MPAAAVEGGLPLAFVPNRGQSNAEVLYLSHGRSAVMAFARDTVSISVNAAEVPGRSEGTAPSKLTSPSAIISMRFVGPQPQHRVEAELPLSGELGYLRHGLPAAARSGVPIFGRLVYRELYPGVDLEYERQPRLLKGTFRLKPLARPSDIAWTYGPRAHVRLDPLSGDLLIGLPDADGLERLVAVERRPEAWQERDGERHPVAASFRPGVDGTVQFSIGTYDPTSALVIDPSMDFSTMIGDTATDEVNGMAVDKSGHVVVVGQTRSGRFPQEPPAPGRPAQVQIFSDGFLSKLTLDGRGLEFGRIIDGDKDDAALDVALDEAGSIYVVGYTQSTDLEVTEEPRPGGRYPLPRGPVGTRDGFVLKLSAGGQLESSGQATFGTYLGGPGLDEIHAVSVDAKGLLYLTGRTDSGSFLLCRPLLNLNFKQGGRDAFAVILDPGRIGEPAAKDCSTGLLRYATYFGGLQDDIGHDIVPLSDGSLVLVGSTDSAGFPRTQVPLTGGSAIVPDAFVARIKPEIANAPLWSYRLGGQGIDEAKSVRLLDDGSLLLAGTTGSADFPVFNAFQGKINRGDPLGSGTDAFVLRLKPDGRTLAFSTYVGGIRSDEGLAVEQGDDGHVYVAGTTLSTDLPLLQAVQALPENMKARIGFLVGMNTSGQPMTSATYLGSGSEDRVVALASDGAGGLYAAGNSRSTLILGTVTSQPIQAQPTVQLGSGDVFVAHLRVETATTTPSSTTTATLTATETASPVPSATPVPGSATASATITPKATATPRPRPILLPLALRLWPPPTVTPTPTSTATMTPVVCATAEREPNDTTAQALGLPVLCAGGTISAALSTEDDAGVNARDLFTVLIRSPMTVSFRLDASAIRARAEYDLTLWHCPAGDCRALAHRGEVGRRVKEIDIALAPGTYFLGVSPRTDVRSPEPYTLGWRLLP